MPVLRRYVNQMSKMMRGLLKCLFFPKKEKMKMQVKTKKIFFFYSGPDKDQTYSYVFPFMVENQHLRSSR